jgi:hypothetical protein
MFVRPVVVGMQDMGGDISEVLRESTTGDIEGKCIVQGFVRPGSVKIQSYSAGILEANHIVYQVTVECDVCSPVEDEIIECMAKNITKAGGRAGRYRSDSYDDILSTGSSSHFNLVL